MRHHVLSMLVLGLSIPAMAQVPENMDLELEALLNTPIQGASKREQRLMDSPQAIEVLTGEEIRQMGIYRLADALKLMTSVDVMEQDGQATYIAIRGAMQQGQPRTVQFLVDGVPLYNGELGSVDVDNLPVPVDLIDKVEVVRGPSSSLYGANAVAGVIAITTKRPTPGAKGGLRYSHAANADHGAVDLELGGKKLGLTAGYSGASYGVRNTPTTDLNNGQAAVLDTNGSHGHSGFARAQFAPNDRSLLWGSVGAATKHVDMPLAGLDAIPAGVTVPPDFPIANFPYQTFNTYTFQVGWSQSWSPAFRTELRASRMQQQSVAGPYPGAGTDPGLTGNYKWQDFQSDLLELQANWDPAATFHVVGGIDHAQSHAGAAAFKGLDTPQDTHGTGGFLNVDWTLAPTLVLSAGGRIENQSLGGSTTSPRAVLVWSVTPKSSLRGGYYSSSRSPQILERYASSTGQLPPGSDGVLIQSVTAPNAALKPEKISSLELGYRQQIASVTLDLTAFKMTFNQLINLDVTSVESGVNAQGPTHVRNQEYLNSGNATDEGLELAVKWLVTPRWSIGANDTMLNYTMEGGQSPSYAPKNKLNLWNRYANGRFSSYLAYQHVDAVSMQGFTSAGTATQQAPRSAIDQVHFHIGWEFKPGLVLSAYGLNAAKAYTPQGASGPLLRQAYLQSARREIGGTIAYRF